MKRYPLAPARLVREKETERRAASLASAVDARAVAEGELTLAHRRVESVARSLNAAIADHRARTDGGDARASDFSRLESFRGAMEQRLSAEQGRERAARDALASAVAAEEEARSALGESSVLGLALEQHEGRFRESERRLAEEREAEEGLELIRGRRA